MRSMLQPIVAGVVELTLVIFMTPYVVLTRIFPAGRPVACFSKA